MTKATVFKIASRNMKNLNALKETGVWAIPSANGPYRTLLKGQVGDKVIFTNQGEPVAVGELVGTPSEKVTTSFPDGEAYALGFGVKVEGFGRIKRADRDKANIEFKPGVVTHSDKRTFNKCLNRLSK